MKPVSIKNECPHCFYETDFASSITGDHKPESGSVSICINCGGAGIFDEALNIRIITEDDAEAMDEGVMAKVRLAQELIRETRKPKTPSSDR